MGEIKKMIISGLRGINRPPLELDFQKGDSVQSMMIYGRNGSGKSSIVDAWEWLFSGKIEYLTREGAGPQAYPHRQAVEGQTYIQVEFTDSAVGNIKIEYDPARITRPKIEGELLELRKRIPHPCHLRYRDLTEFVYKTKAQKYEILSRFMGFGNALNIQNALQTCTGRLEQDSKTLQENIAVSAEKYREIAGRGPKDVQSFIKNLNTILKRQGVPPVTALSDVATSLQKLREKVEKDTKSQELSVCKEVEAIINKFCPMTDIRSAVSKFQEVFSGFRRDEEAISRLILLDLYEKGVEAIESLKVYDRCPLCDEPYKGDLIEHIKTKQGDLSELRKRRNDVDAKRKELHLPIKDTVNKIELACSNLEAKKLKPRFVQFYENLVHLKPHLKDCEVMLERKIENIEKGFDFAAKVNTKEYKSLLESESEIKQYIAKEIEILEKDESRKSLVDDFQKAISLQNSFAAWTQLGKKIKVLNQIKSAYEQIKNHYVEETKKGVQASFDIISSDVAAYFNLLEKDTQAIADPVIKIISERDKAVELEVIFGGEAISPAYKILSESQLNSFGLSIFLACIKNFNNGLKFMILDDVINSFDGYKRPLVIDLLHENFSNYQILLLTHDSVWLDRLQRSFPQWIRKQFLGWEYTIGPRIEAGENSYEQIEGCLLRDNAAEAGRTLGVYLEWILQLLCESCESTVKYNRRNEFTLSVLLEAFRERMKKKLKEDHSVVKLILDFEADAGFRNFCSHWKEPEIPFTSPEIKRIVEKWKTIESKIECQDCHKFIKYQKVNGHEHISCPCRKLNLKSVEYY